MSIDVYVPRDSAALAAGADRVARRIADEAQSRGADIRLVRNGSRGMFWLEPMVEVGTAQGRVAYGPVTVADVAALFDAGFLEGKSHALSLGPTEAIPYLKNQERLTFARMGVTDPLSLEDYEAHDGFTGLRSAIAMAPADVVQQVLDSGLRGRGGAAFPAGIKWKTVLGTAAAQKYVVCNADEGDSGTFSDRMTMEGDPFMLIEGMTIAGLATGATKGYVYVRSEYPHAIAVMNGVVFGPLWGSVINAVGLVAAAIVGYIIALRTSKLLDIEANVARLPAWARHFRIGSWQFLLTVRIIPGLGGTIATQTAAALRVPLFRHVWTMCAIAVPICTLLAVTGNGLANVLESRVVVPTKKYFYDHRQHPRISPSPTASQP